MYSGKPQYKSLKVDRNSRKSKKSKTIFVASPIEDLDGFHQKPFPLLMEKLFYLRHQIKRVFSCVHVTLYVNMSLRFASLF